MVDGLSGAMVPSSDPSLRDVASWPTPEAVRTYAETQIDGDGWSELRTVREDELQTPRSSSGSESREQPPIELADFVRLLPSSLALSELHRDESTTKALRAVLATRGAQRLMQYTPDSIEAAWRSLSQEIQDEFRLAVWQGCFVRTVEHPLAHGVPARVGRLRGYGNAIVPHVAAEFIHAYVAAMESRS
jgi:hypothetical protein